MKIYLVGGAVRDQLLGIPVKEKDWVVVGASVDDMVQLGFRQVGKDFPVFLHPDTNEEYALARMERKVSAGYKGFQFDASPEVSLADDLIRRDLTINAMAESLEGELIDPYGGKQDLDQRLLRHVSPAFSEDPVRILRVGRFLARYLHLGFSVAPETIALMREMVTAGEVNALVAERVWKELERALGEPNPEAFFKVLHECQALPILFPGLQMDGIGMQALAEAVKQTDHPNVRLAALLHAQTPAKEVIGQFALRYRIPNAYKELALLSAYHYEKGIHAKQMTMNALLDFLYSVDVFRREARFHLLIQTFSAIAHARQINFDSEWLKQAATMVKAIPVQKFIQEGYTSIALANKLKEERLAALLAWQPVKR